MWPLSSLKASFALDSVAVLWVFTSLSAKSEAVEEATLLCWGLLRLLVDFMKPPMLRRFGLDLRLVPIIASMRDPRNGFSAIGLLMFDELSRLEFF